MNIIKIGTTFLSLLMLSTVMAVFPVNAETVPPPPPGFHGQYDVPRVYINTFDGNGAALKKSDGYTEADIQVVDTDGMIADYSGQVKIRGNSTALAEKKAYTVKFDKKQNLFDMGEAKKWSLLANCFDPTLIRNSLVFDLAEHLQLAYTSQHTVTEVWLDGVYLGSYDLVEPVEVKANRVDIDTEGQKDFLLEYETTRNEEDEIYLTSGSWRFRLESPEEPDEGQLAYINDVMANIKTALRSYDYAQVKQWIDTESFAKFYLLNELVKNVDFGYSSVYVYYHNGKLYAGPVWDFDLSMGNTNPNYNSGYTRASNPEGLQIAEKHFYDYLFRYKEFYQEFIAIYAENYHYIENIYAPDGQIDILTRRYQNVFERNFSEAGWEVAKSYYELMRIPEATYQENVEYLRNWLHRRNEWLAGYYGIFDEQVVGDVNADGVLNVLDVVLLQKWLLAVPDTALPRWQVADLCDDNRLDAFDLTLLKRRLIYG